MAKLFANKGDTITADDGSLVATFNRDVMRSEKMLRSQLDWEITPPKSGTSALELPGFRLAPNGLSAQVRLNGEWHPSDG